MEEKINRFYKKAATNLCVILSAIVFFVATITKNKISGHCPTINQDGNSITIKNKPQYEPYLSDYKRSN